MRTTAGFSLMEVMVSLFISAMILTAVLSTLDSTQKAVDAIHNLIETESSGPRLMALLRDDLSRITVYDVDAYEVFHGTSHTIHGADADRIDFLAYARSRNPHWDVMQGAYVRSPLVEVGYWLRPRPNSSDFMELYRREDFMHDEEPFLGGNWGLLNNRMINFSVLYADKPAYEPSWEEEWSSLEKGGLPFVLEVVMELEIQPRKSSESRILLGANRSRLEFKDYFTTPEPVRWVFRNRIHPLVPDSEGVGPQSSQTELPDDSREDNQVKGPQDS